jgi:hypothetical protein
MKYKGKVVSGSSLLTILGVVCFATVIVSAVLITSNTLSFGSTNVTPASIVLMDSGPDTTSVVVGGPATYHFNANVATALTSGANYTVDIQGTGILPGAITNGTIWINGVSHVLPAFYVVSSTHIASSWDPGTQASGATIPCIISITYATASTYTVSVTLKGNA